MTADAQGPARRAVEQAARLAYGRLLAWLVRRAGDVALAEDALGDAFARALERWPAEGVPANPEAWLLVVARRRLVDLFRAGQVRLNAVDELSLRAAATPATVDLPDERLGLMLVCADPLLDPGVHAPLMLQTVLGLKAERLAAAWLTSPAAMGQRLSRAKARLKGAGRTFRVPEPPLDDAKLGGVREAVYAAYGIGWDGLGGSDPKVRGLTTEAIWLGRVLVHVVPDDAEARGLLALMLFLEARRAARRDADGAFVPFDRQDLARWNRDLLREAEGLLRDAARGSRPGAFQLEAAVQSAMVEARLTGADLDRQIVELHAALVALAPTIANRLGHVAALARVEGSTAALAVLADVTAPAYQPYWALKGELLARSGRTVDAEAAFVRAAALTEDVAVRRHLLARTGP